MTAAIERVLAELERWGLLLASDPVLPSVAGLVAGRTVRGSWWADESAREIYAVLTALADAHGLASVKLVSGKVTLLHARMEPALLSIATSGEAWQGDGLSSLAARVLDAIVAEGSLRLDRLAERGVGSRKEISKAAAELEKRLLVASTDEHTERGAHERLLMSWEVFARSRELAPSPAPVEECRRAFEAIVDAWNERLGAPSVLPWTRG